MTDTEIKTNDCYGDLQRLLDMHDPNVDKPAAPGQLRPNAKQ